MNKNYIILGGAVLIAIVFVFVVLAQRMADRLSDSSFSSSTEPSTAEEEGFFAPPASRTPESQSPAIVLLNAQNNSGEAGIAFIVENEEDKLVVSLGVNDAPANVSQPAHVHLGSCANLGGVKHPLSNVVDGVSETDLDISLSELQAELPLAINVHKSADEAGTYVACGDILF